MPQLSGGAPLLTSEVDASVAATPHEDAGGACAGCTRLVREAQDSGWWNSRLRVLFCLWGGTFLWSTAWLGGYVVWLAEGCIVFLPFVSDFGAAGSPTYHWFAVSMTLGALLWLPTWFDHFRATQHDDATRHAQSIGVSAPPTTDAGDAEAQQLVSSTTAIGPAPSFAARLQPYVGVICSLGIIGVALDPEDERLVVHGLSANAAFMGGVAFTWISTWLRRQRGQPWCVSLLGNIIATGSFLALGPSMTVACAQAPTCDVTDPLGYFSESLRLLQTDHGRYCTGGDLRPPPAPPPAEPSMHGVAGTNLAAFFEWTMLIAILVNVLGSFHHDLKRWPAGR